MVARDAAELAFDTREFLMRARRVLAFNIEESLYSPNSWVEQRLQPRLRIVGVRIIEHKDQSGP
jgi:hypothetical protein